VNVGVVGLHMIETARVLEVATTPLVVLKLFVRVVQSSEGSSV
jgi:hypothetical protein